VSFLRSLVLQIFFQNLSFRLLSLYFSIFFLFFVNVYGVFTFQRSFVHLPCYSSHFVLIFQSALPFYIFFVDLFYFTATFFLSFSLYFLHPPVYLDIIQGYVF